MSSNFVFLLNLEVNLAFSYSVRRIASWVGKFYYFGLIIVV